MRRLFIIRKDLHLSAGKLAAMVGHCAEAYFTNIIKKAYSDSTDDGLLEIHENSLIFPIEVDRDTFDKYINGIFTKTICEAKNKNQLMKVIELINEHNNQVIHEDEILIKDIDYGFINDKCLTELTPENEDGTTTIGIWFKPLPDDISHKFSKKYKLYRD